MMALKKKEENGLWMKSFQSVGYCVADKLGDSKCETFLN
jgi:hypothetical protein